MKLSFKSLMVTVPRSVRTAETVTAASVSLKKKKRGSLSTSDQIKLSRAARERGSEKFAFFDTNVNVRNNFKAVYDLRM